MVFKLLPVIFFVLAMCKATGNMKRFHAVDGFLTSFTKSSVNFNTPWARSVVECGSHCTADNVCAGFEFNEATQKCTIYQGCLTVGNTTDEVENVKVYAQAFHKDLAHSKFIVIPNTRAETGIEPGFGFGT